MLAPDTPADHKIIAYRNVISLGKYNRGPVELGHNVVPYFCSEPEIDLKNAEVAAQTEPGWACKGTGMLGCVLKTFLRLTFYLLKTGLKPSEPDRSLERPKRTALFDDNDKDSDGIDKDRAFIADISYEETEVGGAPRTTRKLPPTKIGGHGRFRASADSNNRRV